MPTKAELEARVEELEKENAKLAKKKQTKAPVAPEVGAVELLTEIHQACQADSRLTRAAKLTARAQTQLTKAGLNPVIEVK